MLIFSPSTWEVTLVSLRTLATALAVWIILALATITFRYKLVKHGDLNRAEMKLFEPPNSRSSEVLVPRVSILHTVMNAAIF